MNPEAARETHRTLVERTDLYTNVIDAAGSYDAKVDSSANCSLAAHILNAVTIGVNTFVFNAVGPDESYVDYEEEIRVLASALALHDTNKFLQEAHGIEFGGNTPEAFDQYFDPEADDLEGDPFGIEEFLGEGYRDDLLYLVQRTETTEDSTSTRAIGSKFAGLARYCRIGDVVSSVALKRGIEGAYEKLRDILDDDRVHLVRFTELEQPILNDVLLSSTKEVLAGEAGGDAHGVIIGSSPSGVLYLGESIERSELRCRVANRAPKRIGTDFQFSCKLTWNSFDYDVLAEIDLPTTQKIDQIQKQAEELLLSGSGGIEAFESIPNGFRDYLPVLVKAIYEENRKEYPTRKLDDAYQEVYDSIEGSKNSKAQKIKIHFLAHLCHKHSSYTEGLDLLREQLETEIREDLSPEVRTVKQTVDRFFGDQTVAELGTKDGMCFLCGAVASTRYQKGRGIYRTYGYSRRVPPHEEYKSICEVCNLEYALLSHICEQSDVSTNNAVEVAYFYFDDFLGDVRVRRRRAGNLVQGDSSELDDRDVRVSLVGPQYYLQPVYVLNQNHRMAVVRQVMEAAQDSGMKVVIGRPFTRFESADSVFADEEATRPQELLALDQAERFGPLPSFVEEDRTDSHLRRALQLFRIMGIVGQEANMRNPYLQLDRDTFHSIADFAVVNHQNAARLTVLQSYFQTYHAQSLMDMKTVADRGIDLFGKQYNSKYKKTKVFREALDAFLSGKNQRMDEPDLVEYVESQVYATADREDYAGHVTPDQAKAFVDAIKTYLVDNDLYDLKKLSDWEDALVNSYYYAYDQALTDRQ